MRVVGVDPSLTGTGVACATLNRDGSVSWESFTVKSKASAPSIAARMKRLSWIKRSALARLVPGSLMVIEAPAYSRSQGSRHERSGLWWLIVDLATEKGSRAVEVSPTARAKYATGRGNASKAEVVAAVSARYGVVPANDNEADAIALAALGFRLAGFPIEATSEPWMDEVAATVRGEL